MNGPPRPVARIANAGLAVSGLALVVVLGTGGTRIDLGVTSIGLRELAGPFTFVCFFAALRLLVSQRSSGLEARAVTFFARRGLPPRDAEAALGGAARTGALLGAGAGFAVGAADLARLLLPAGVPWASLGDLAALTGALLGVTAVVGAAWGAALGALAAGASRALGLRPGRYAVGRVVCAALLLSVSAGPWLAGEPGPGEHAPMVLLGAAGVGLAAVGLAFFLAPAAVLSARRGHWTTALAGGVGLFVVAVAAAAAALGPTGLYGPARDAAYPNVLVVSVEGLRREVLVDRAAARRWTPMISELAERGAVFAETISPSTDFDAAATSLLTGLYPAAHGVRGVGDPANPGVEALPQILASHGYRTAAFVAGDPAAPAPEAGFFERFDDPEWLVAWLGRSVFGRPAALLARRDAASHPAPELAQSFRDWLTGLPRGPWFAWVRFGDLRRPAPLTAPLFEGEIGDLRPPDSNQPPSPAPSWAAEADRRRPVRDWVYGYAEAARHLDAEIAELQRVVAARGDLHRTVVVVVGTIGAPFGEGGVWLDRPAGLEEGTVVSPWIIFGPGVRPGSVVEGPCSLVDVAPTVLGLIGLAGGRDFEGEDLARYFSAAGGQPRDPQSGPAFVETPDGAKGVRLGSWMFLRGRDGAERMFFVEDGAEHEIATPRGRDERLRLQLSDLLARRAADEAAATP